MCADATRIAMLRTSDEDGAIHDPVEDLDEALDPVVPIPLSDRTSREAAIAAM